VTPRLAARQRLLRQQIAQPRFTKAEDLVRWMGAVQAQDYLGSLWAIGLRLRGSATEADVEDAVAARKIVRTWPMRGTLHFVAAADVHWMLALLTPRVIARSAGRYRELELADRDFGRSGDVLARALEGGRALTRREAYAVIERGGVSTAGQRGIHILGHLAQKGLLCFGARRGKQPTFVRLDEWVPAGKKMARDQAIAALAERYVASHGPATVQDFAWWSGLLMKDAEAGMDAAGDPRRASPTAQPRGAALLPMWDEYLVAYKDRAPATSDLPEPKKASVFTPSIVVDGTVRGAWSRTLSAKTVRVRLDFWVDVTSGERRTVEREAERYGRFVRRVVAISG
jgi:hypothetical protein